MSIVTHRALALALGLGCCIWACRPASPALATGFLDVDGGRLYYEVAGQGQPVVLIHGFSLDTRMWDDQFQELSRSFRVIRYDVRGFGKSDRPQESHAAGNDLRVLLEHLEVQRAHLVGMSMGGSIATNFTLEYPDMVSALVTVGATLDGYTYSPDFLQRIEALYAAADSGGVEAAKRLWLRQPWVTPVHDSARLAPKIRTMVDTYSGIHLTNPEIGWGSTDPPAIARLEEINVPVLVIAGVYDTPDILAIADTVAERIPNAKKVVVQGAGHLLNIERPKEFNELLIEFLTKQAGPA